MATISDILDEYRSKLDYLDLELIIAHAIKKSREFVLTHPEFAIAKNYELRIMNYAERRIKHEPLAYILGEKEFYGLKFKVDKNTLIPRPETEMMVDLVSQIVHRKSICDMRYVICDIGTGSGNIIVALAHSMEHGTWNNLELYGTDISKEAIKIAKYNYRKNKTENKINFLHGNMLEPVIKKCFMFHAPCSMIVAANLPYLSPKIYKSCVKDIKKYEPKSALLSQKEGLAHYEELLKQLQLLATSRWSLFTVFLEISPEQKNKLPKIIKKYFPKSKITFHKDLSGRWRICELQINKSSTNLQISK